jgi:hypothetical protein
MRPRLWIVAVLLTVSVMLVATATASAHDQPEGGDASYVMADWMFWTFVLFGGASFIGVCAAWKLGFFRDMDDQRLVPLYIDEPDYYTPEWALEPDEPPPSTNGGSPEVSDGQRE